MALDRLIATRMSVREREREYALVQFHRRDGIFRLSAKTFHCWHLNSDINEMKWVPCNRITKSR